MVIYLAVLCLILFVVLILMVIKLYLIKKSCREITCGIEECLEEETNMLLDVSSNVQAIRNLASKINKQLKLMTKERQRYELGNYQLMEAVTKISHDLRTPLTAIYGYLDLLEEEQMSEDGKRYLSMISGRTDALKQLTEELFQYTLLMTKEDKKQKVNLNRALEECLASFYGVFKTKGIEPEITITEKKVERYVNRSALFRIFENIISNAIKYSDGDFTVSMKEDGSIEFSNGAKNLNPVLTARLFDKFYTIQTGKKSTGLGLYIAKELIEKEEGTISATYDKERLYTKICWKK